MTDELRVVNMCANVPYTDGDVAPEDIKCVVFEGKRAKDAVKTVQSRMRDHISKRRIEDETIIERDRQLAMLNALLANDNIGADCKLMRAEIGRKLSAYKRQDVVKKKLNVAKLATLTDVLDLLIECKCTCYYCKEPVFVIYEQVRAKKQWTLDRIDNDAGHNRDNVVIACLSCNLKRRLTDDEKFLFTRNLRIAKADHS